MEYEQKKRLQELAKSHFRLKKLIEEHEELENRLARYQTRAYLTTNEEVEEKQLKMRKLRGKREMVRILEGAEAQSATAC